MIYNLVVTKKGSKVDDLTKVQLSLTNCPVRGLQIGQAPPVLEKKCHAHPIAGKSLEKKQETLVYVLVLPPPTAADYDIYPLASFPRKSPGMAI